MSETPTNTPQPPKPPQDDPADERNYPTPVSVFYRGSHTSKVIMKIHQMKPFLQRGMKKKPK